MQIAQEIDLLGETDIASEYDNANEFRPPRIRELSYPQRSLTLQTYQSPHLLSKDADTPVRSLSDFDIETQTLQLYDFYLTKQPLKLN